MITWFLETYGLYQGVVWDRILSSFYMAWLFVFSGAGGLTKVVEVSWEWEVWCSLVTWQYMSRCCFCIYKFPKRAVYYCCNSPVTCLTFSWGVLMKISSDSCKKHAQDTKPKVGCSQRLRYCILKICYRNFVLDWTNLTKWYLLLWIFLS